MLRHRCFFGVKSALTALTVFVCLTLAPALMAAETEESLPLKATRLFQIGKLTVTNSMLVSWIVAIAVILFAQIATRKIKPVPSGAQNFWEWLVESLYNFLESIIGRDLVKKTFWFFATIFIFILFTNWAGLIPGVGTIGWGHRDPTTGIFHVDRPLFRGANADLNMTFAMAAVFFVLWTFWAFQTQGAGGVVLHLFGPKGETSGFMKIPLIIIFFLVGLLEIVSILFRPISLSFRLFGNIYAGETMAGRLGPGAGLHAVNRRFHPFDCTTRTRPRDALKIWRL